MIEIVRESRIQAPAEDIWKIVSDPHRAPEWFTFADRVEVRSGSGVGQLRTQHGHWGRKPSEVDQEIIAYEPNHLLAWRHLAERLNGKPAPRFAASTEFSIELTPAGSATLVRLRTRQEPATPLRGLIMKLFGTKEVAQGMTRSLTTLATLLTP